MSIEDDQRAYLERVLSRTGWLPTELARRAGLDHSTLSRFIGGGRDGHVLRHSTIRKLEQVSGIIFGAPRMIGSEAQQRPTNSFAEAEAVPLRMDDATPLTELVRAALAGSNNSDPWVLRSRALEGVGYRPGDVLIVALGETPRPGEVVCAQIYDWTKGMAETVFRLYQPPCLVAVSSDERLLRPYIVDDGATTIKGVVTHCLRLRQAA